VAQDVAAEIPVGAALAIGVLFFVSWAISRGLLGAWRVTFGYLLEQLAGILSFSVLHVHVNLGGPLTAIDNKIQGALGAAAAKSEHGMGYFFHAAAKIQLWIVRQFYEMGAEIYDAYHWLRHVHVPNVTTIVRQQALPRALIHRYVDALIQPWIVKLQRAARAAAHGAEVVITQRIELPHLGEWQWLHRHWKALTEVIAGAGLGAVAGALPWVHVFPRLRSLERWETATKRRLRRVEALLGVSALAAAMANVLGLPNWRCLTRGNVGRTARALCGLPTNVLNDLLGLLLDFALVADICQVVELLNEGLKVIQPELTAFVSVTSGALCHGDYSEPPAVAVQGFEETPATASLGLAA
jgi:hypothetical protein